MVLNLNFPKIKPNIIPRPTYSWFAQCLIGPPIWYSGFKLSNQTNFRDSGVAKCSCSQHWKCRRLKTLEFSYWNTPEFLYSMIIVKEKLIVHDNHYCHDRSWDLSDFNLLSQLYSLKYLQMNNSYSNAYFSSNKWGSKAPWPPATHLMDIRALSWYWKEIEHTIWRIF